MSVLDTEGPLKFETERLPDVGLELGLIAFLVAALPEENLPVDALTEKPIARFWLGLSMQSRSQ